MVVDNAIVVLENLYRHLEMRKSARQAAIDGGREVCVLASTLTTIAVFVPIVIQNDEVSQLFKNMAVAISAAVAVNRRPERIAAEPSVVASRRVEPPRASGRPGAAPVPAERCRLEAARTRPPNPKQEEAR